MFCNNCGKEINGTSIFCRFCGNKINIKKHHTKTDNNLKHTKKEVNNLEIQIPSVLGDKKIVFTNNSLSYRDKTIKYQEITGMSCKQIYHSVNLIPTEQEFSFSYYKENEVIKINFGTALHIGAKNRKEVFAKIYMASQLLIVPIIIEKICSQIIYNNETVNIGKIFLNKKGYFKRKFFGGEEYVCWEDNIGEPIIKSGNVILYKFTSTKFEEFLEIPLDTVNAIVLPELIKKIYLILGKK